jgi:lipoprotein-anchoring transpeptidase ErfK/SrfK
LPLWLAGEEMRFKLKAMPFGVVRSLLILCASGAFAVNISAQEIPGKPAVPKKVEPGLESAVRWKWRVAPSDPAHWGLEIPTPTPSPSPISAPTPEIRPALYEVKPGDALILIGRRFGLTVEQIKAFNGLKNDKIRAGQTLKIPSLAESRTLAPPPAKKHKATEESPESRISTETGADLEKLRLQIFLDREQFSAGPIAADPGPPLAKISLLYEGTHEDAKDDASLGAKARAALGNVFTRYKLRAEDFRFIAPPKAETVEPKQTPIVSHAKSKKLPSSQHPTKLPFRAPTVTHTQPTYEQLTAMPMLAYRTPWEFVAERFHCQESYLRALNPKLPAQPGIGTEFVVPNVIPFEIEKALDEPLQPQADPNNPVTAAVIGLSQLNIYQGGALFAVFPLSPARPGLHGRGSWTILDVIPRPQLATFQEERPELSRKPAPAGTIPVPPPSPPKPILSSEQYLAAGPRNPVGILWINLAKAKSTDPLPYGLHGTSAPDQMNALQSVGGLRLTNWDICRAVHHLPFGTPLEWR